MTGSVQSNLSQHQVAAFYHDEFVEDQTRDFIKLLAPAGGTPLTVDIGGGCGFFARRLGEIAGVRVRVLDLDPVSVETCRQAGVEAVQGDALAPAAAGDEQVASFNLVLHHLVGRSERQTRELQTRALVAWRRQVRHVFVNEYIYESYVGRLSGWLIYQITSSRILSAIGRQIAKFVPSFRANTFGVGVRFRAHQEWRELFEAAGFDVQASVQGAPERVALPLRLLLIKYIRRDSYLLTPRAC
jgi:hypothetical protein